MQRNNLYQDLGIIALSVLIAVLIGRSGAIETFVRSMGEARLIGSFLAGILFTSVFTATPAVVFLGEFAQAEPVWAVSVLGALGAVVGDTLIFRFVRDRFAGDLLSLLRQQQRRRFKKLLRLPSARWILGALGLLIIASPFPDELGVAFLGFARTRREFFSALSFAANFLGILAIGFAARSLGGAG